MRFAFGLAFVTCVRESVHFCVIFAKAFSSVVLFQGTPVLAWYAVRVYVASIDLLEAWRLKSVA